MNLLFFLFFGIMYGKPASKEKVDLKIIITNIQALKGNIQLGVFNNPETFLETGKAYKSFSRKVTNDSLVIEFKDVEKDSYAISVYQDKNLDNKCNLNFLGIPTEPYGFSQNFKPKFSKPTFNDCKINAQQNMSIIIKLID